MAVSIADIAKASTSGSSVTSITTPAFVTTSNANRAGLLGLSVDAATISAITGSIGGVSGSAITGTDSSSIATTVRTLQFGVTAPPSGSQTATMSWTTLSSCVFGAVTTSGVDQTTPFNNGTVTTASNFGPSSVAITSANGDLTCDTIAEDSGLSAPSAPTQTSLWTINGAVDGAGSRGPGTGNTTHQWTLSPATTVWTASGANFKQAAATGDTLMAQACL